MLVLFLLKRAAGAVGLLNNHVFQNGLHILAEARNVFLAQHLLLCQFRFGKGTDLLEPCQFVDPVDLFFFHVRYIPFCFGSLFGRLMIMVQGKWFPTGSDISQALGVREAVFGFAADPLDAMAQQVVVYREGLPVGSARLWWQDGAFRLGCLGVLPGERGKGYGDLLIRLLLFKALTHNAARIALETPADTLPFFAKYGFEDDGETNGLHAMHILGENVQLSHCGGNCATCHSRSEECIPKALR